jgi:hypothetical protein
MYTLLSTEDLTITGSHDFREASIYDTWASWVEVTSFEKASIDRPFGLGVIVGRVGANFYHAYVTRLPRDALFRRPSMRANFSCSRQNSTRHSLCLNVKQKTV